MLAWYWEYFDRMRLSDISSLVRTIDPKYPTNLAIVSISTITGGIFLIIGLIQNLGIQASFYSGVTAGFSVFLTWALSREIDPDHQLSAFVGLGLVLPGLWFLGSPNLLVIFSLLILARIINRSTGQPAKFLDSLLILGLGTLLSFSGYPVYGILIAVALFLDSRLPNPNRRHLYFSVLMAGITLILAFSSELGFPNISIAGNELVLLSIIGVLYLPLIISSRKSESMCDFTNEYITPVRIQTAQVFLFLSGMIVWLLQGTSGLVSTFPLWCAIVGVSLYYLTTELYRTLRRL
jgi:hypothetical protein